MPDPFPARESLTIHFAHVAYRLAERFAARDTGIRHFQTWSAEDTAERIGEGDVLVLSGFWADALLERAAKLRFIQVCAAGYDQFGLDALQARGVRMANGSGVNKNAVSEHALSLMLAFTRQLHVARDNQARRRWRGMISEIARREDELGGKTVLVYGLGAIGARVARLARAFGMRAIGIKRDTANHDGSADEVRSPEAFRDAIPEADFVVLTCPLTEETAGLMNAETFSLMRSDACLVNVARGGCVDEDDLVAALESGAIAGAGIDTTREEPLPESSPLWGLDNAIVTPHTGGETRRYEDNVVDILVDNLDRFWRGEDELRNGIV